MPEGSKTGQRIRHSPKREAEVVTLKAPEGEPILQQKAPGPSGDLFRSRLPGIDSVDAGPAKVPCISGYDRCPHRAGDRRDLAVGLAYGSSSSPARSSQHGVSPGSITAKWQGTIIEEHAEEPFGGGSESAPPLPFRQSGDAGSNLRLGYGGHKQVARELIVHPPQDLGVGRSLISSDTTLVSRTNINAALNRTAGAGAWAAWG